MQNVLLLIDTRNLSYFIPKTFANPNAKLDYSKFLQRVTNEDHLYRSVAFVAEANQNNKKFTGFLKNLGLEVKLYYPLYDHSKNAEEPDRIWVKPNVSMAVTAMQIIQNGKIDRVVLASNEYDLIGLVEGIKAAGLICEIYASRIPQALKEVSNKYTEIDQSLLYVPKAIEAQ